MEAFLDKLGKKFGARFVSLVQDSPLLMRDIRLLMERGVTVRRLNGKTYAYSREHTEASPSGLICIGSKASPTDKVLLLAHEAYHILYGRSPSNPNPSRMSRRRFVGLCLQEEARALVHEARVTEQLYDAGNKLPFKHMAYMAAYFRGGYREIRLLLEFDHTAMSAISHAEEYGRLYDRTARSQRKARAMRYGNSKKAA